MQHAGQGFHVGRSPIPFDRDRFIQSIDYAVAGPTDTERLAKDACCRVSDVIRIIQLANLIA